MGDTPIVQVASVMGMILMALAAVAVIAGWLYGRFRKSADYKIAEDREEAEEVKNKLIQNLKDRLTLLEKENRQACQRIEEQATKLEAQSTELELLKERYSWIRDIVLRQCRHANLDEETGGCQHCALRLWYGKNSRSET